METKDALERTTQALEAANDNYDVLEGRLVAVEKNYLSVKKKYDSIVGESVGMQVTQLKKVEGKVINVNYDWNYVIINLGKEHNLPENLEMTVARDQEYICKVLVTRVYPKYAVAEILPKNKHGNVIEGDRVIF